MFLQGVDKKRALSCCKIYFIHKSICGKKMQSQISGMCGRALLKELYFFVSQRTTLFVLYIFLLNTSYQECIMEKWRQILVECVGVRCLRSRQVPLLCKPTYNANISPTSFQMYVGFLPVLRIRMQGYQQQRISGIVERCKHI